MLRVNIEWKITKNDFWKKKEKKEREKDFFVLRQGIEFMTNVAVRVWFYVSCLAIDLALSRNFFQKVKCEVAKKIIMVEKSFQCQEKNRLVPKKERLAHFRATL